MGGHREREREREMKDIFDQYSKKKLIMLSLHLNQGCWLS